MPILSVSHLSKHFPLKSKLKGGFHILKAVDDISFTLAEGEILGLLGPNGAGKTTTLQMILGVLTPTDGKISYFGKNLGLHRAEILEQINFSSTYVHLPELLTVRESLTFISYLYAIPERNKRLQKIIDIFNLGELLDTKYGRLSAGQKTRVGLAKAFINLPKVLLLDEPTASLDPEVAQYVRQFLLSERKKFNVSIIITSHNMSEVEELCDRVIFINRGQLIADDTPERLAQSIRVCHVELLASDTAALLRWCAKNNLPHRAENKYVVVDIEENKIADFLQALSAAGLTYTEISIAKPTLEDYFLEVIRQ